MTDTTDPARELNVSGAAAGTERVTPARPSNANCTGLRAHLGAYGVSILGLAALVPASGRLLVLPYVERWRDSAGSGRI